MNMKKTIGIIGAAALAVLISYGSGNVQAAGHQTIREGVYIGSLDVSGMNAKDASAALTEFVEDMKKNEYTLHGAAGDMTITAETMKLDCDVEAAVAEAMDVANTGNLVARFKETKNLEINPVSVDMHLSVDKEATANAISSHKSELNIPAVPHSLSMSGGIHFVQGTEGQTVNVADSVSGIVDHLENLWDGSNCDIKLAIDIVQPKGSEEDLKKVKDVLGTYTTDFSSSTANRKTNVSNACKKVNGTLLLPGEQASVYSLIAPLTEENGYATAAAYQKGQVIDSVGGGVCQVATTLYNAVIRAELKVNQRFNHSMIVTYVPASSDAAIAGTYKDLKFTNSTDAPVYIYGTSSNGKLTFTIYGHETRPSSRKISFESETISEEEGGLEIQYDSSQALGYSEKIQSSHKGIVARLWKIVKEDGKEVSRDIFNKSTYKASPRIILIGTKGATSAQISQLKAAAAEGNESKVKSLASKFAAENKKAADQKPSSEKPSSEKPSTQKPSTQKPSSEKPSETTSEKPSESAPEAPEASNEQ